MSIAGVIAGVKTKTTRNFTLMAYVNLEDSTGTIELLCFSRVLDESGSCIKENVPVLATGKISVREEKEPQLMVDSVSPLSHLEAVQGKGETLYLRLPSRTFRRRGSSRAGRRR